MNTAYRLVTKVDTDRIREARKAIEEMHNDIATEAVRYPINGENPEIYHLLVENDKDTGTSLAIATDSSLDAAFSSCREVSGVPETG